MTLELGQPGTRAAGLVRESGGEWRHPSISDQIYLANCGKRLEKLYPPLWQPQEFLEEPKVKGTQ